MPLDLVGRVLRQILVDFGDDPLLDVGVKCASQVSQRPRRSHHDQRLGLALVLSGTALMFFFGLRYFGQSVAHAPGDFVAMALLLWMLTNDPHDPQRKSGTLTALALFGGLTAIFEFMIGTLPAARLGR